MFQEELDVVVARTGRWRLRTERRVVVVDGEGLRVGDRFIAPAQIASVSFRPGTGRRPTALCSDRRGSTLVEVVFDGLGAAHRFLAALGREPAECRQNFSASGPFSATWLPTLLMMLVPIALATLIALALSGSRLGMPASVLVSLGVVAATVFALLRPAQLVVGADGILWTWYGRRRFVPWSDVVARKGDDSILAGSGFSDIVVHTRQGHPLVLPQAISASRSEQEALRRRIDLLWRAHAAHENDAVIYRLLRGERALGPWREALSRLRGGEGYREMTVSEESLWRIVEDASAPEDARAGAALALRGTEDAAPRLRVAAEAVASPHLRVALEAAGDPAVEEAVLDEALAKVSRASPGSS